ncbi:MAG: ATP-dependent Clp protease ATP-binding subunit, partial [Bacteroidetes bacterium]|nr:ATP-dependent Clp protease ATP-binding subunit [Bacteroidota bacterium]
GFGFGSPSDKDAYKQMKSTIEDALKRVFNPEFLNRLDEAMVFHPLEKSHIMEIIQIQMKELVSRIDGMGISIELTKPAREFLADKGYDPAFGARPLRRALQRYLEDPMAEEILKGKYPEGSVIKVKVNKKAETLRFTGVIPAPKEDNTKEDGDVKEEEKPADVS